MLELFANDPGQGPWNAMSSRSPTTEGFRIIFRSMTIPFAEIAWRWTFATAAWFLGVVYLLEYVGSLPVTGLQRLMLGTDQPVLVWRAIRQIFEGSGFRFTRAGILLAIALTVAWVVLASFGRAATIPAIMEEFGIKVSPDQPDHGSPDHRSPDHRSSILPSLMVLNALRAVLTLATLIAGIGSLLLGSYVWASTRASVTDVTRLGLALFCCAVLFRAILNWLLSTASIFVVTGQRRAFAAISATVDLLYDRGGALCIPGIWFGLAHLGAFIVTFMAGLTVLGAAGALGGGTFLVLELALIIAYCAVADFLYTGRLAAYVAIIEGGASLEVPPAVNFFNGGDGWSQIDRDELILSDQPLPAT